MLSTISSNSILTFMPVVNTPLTIRGIAKEILQNQPFTRLTKKSLFGVTVTILTNIAFYYLIKSWINPKPPALSSLKKNPSDKPTVNPLSDTDKRYQDIVEKCKAALLKSALASEEEAKRFSDKLKSNIRQVNKPEVITLFSKGEGWDNKLVSRKVILLPQKEGSVILRLKKKVGMSAYAKVRLVLYPDHENFSRMAVEKKIQLNEIFHKDQKQDPIAEYECVKILNAIEEKHRTCLAVPYVQGQYAKGIKMFFISEKAEGTIESQIKDFTDKKKRQVIEDLLTGLAQLHEAGFVHRDIALDNILFYANGRAKVFDFGKAIPIGTKTPYWARLGYDEPGYISISNENVTASCSQDVWAAGLVILQLINIRPLWPLKGLVNPKNLEDQISQLKPGWLEQTGLTKDRPFYELLTKMLDLDSNQRCSAADALELYRRIPRLS